MEFEGVLPYPWPGKCSTNPSTAFLYAAPKLCTYSLFSVLGRPTCQPKPALPDFTTPTVL
jgi:hypothetical protein